MLGEKAASILEIEKDQSQKLEKNAARESKGRSGSRAFFCTFAWLMLTACIWLLATAAARAYLHLKIRAQKFRLYKSVKVKAHNKQQTPLPSISYGGQSCGGKISSAAGR